MQNKGWVPGAVRLRWHVDKAGYEAIRLGDLYRRHRRAEPREPGPKTSSFLTGRDRAGTILEDESPVDEEIALVPRGGEKRDYDVVLGQDFVFWDIVKGKPGEAALAAMEFTKTWGLLSGGPYILLRDFMLMRLRLQSLLDGKRKFKALAANNEGLRLGTAEIKISKARAKDAPDVFWFVRSLESFCWIEFLSHAGGAVRIQRCHRCIAYFRRPNVTGPVGKYCSNACKQAAWRKGKSRA